MILCAKSDLLCALRRSAGAADLLSSAPSVKISPSDGRRFKETRRWATFQRVAPPPLAPPLPQHLSGCFSLRHTCSVPLPDALNRAPLFSSSTEDGSLLDAESVTCKFMSRRGMDGPDSCGGNVRSARWTRCRSLPASEDFTNSGREMDHAQTNKMYEIKSHLGFAHNTSSITWRHKGLFSWSLFLFDSHSLFSNSTTHSLAINVFSLEWKYNWPLKKENSEIAAFSRSSSWQNIMEYIFRDYRVVL